MDKTDVTTLFGQAIGDFERISNHVRRHNTLFGSGIDD